MKEKIGKKTTTTKRKLHSLSLACKAARGNCAIFNVQTYLDIWHLVWLTNIYLLCHTKAN